MLPNRLKLLLAGVALLGLGLRAEAQQVPYPTPGAQVPLTVTALVTDSSNGQPVPFANSSLETLKDSVVTADVVDGNGRLKLTVPRPGVYRLMVSFVGYGSYKKVVRVTAPLDLGTIALGRSVQQYAEVEVQGVVAPMRQRGDTTEYNAAAFKTSRDATSEDLVSKMPGISVDNGSVKANGENVTQVTVDGKPFFGDDPTQTLRNLPSEMVDRVQLLDQRSEASRLTGFDDGNRTKTLNIVTKANRRKGVFGKGSAAVGNDGRYAGSVVANRFDGDRRITMLGQANNVNQQNFQVQDLVGAFGNGRGGGGGGGRPGGGFGGGGGGFGGLGNFLVGQQGGINTTTAGGVNYSDSWNKVLDVSSSYFFNRGYNVSDQFTNRTYITGGDTAQRFKEQQTSRNLNLNHRAAARFEYKPDTMNTVVFRPRFSTQSNASHSATLDTTARGMRLQSTLDNDTRTDQNGVNASSELVFRHRFQKMGRALVLSSNASLNNSESETRRNTISTRVLGGVLQPDSARQHIYTKSRNQTGNLGITYTEPAGKHSQVLVVYQPELQFRSSDRDTRNVGENEAESQDPTLSNSLTSTYLTQQVGVGARYAYLKLNYGGQVNYQRSDLNTRQQYLGQEAQLNRGFNAVLPQFNLQYRISKEKNFNLNLNTNTAAPSASQLQSVVNTANLLALSTGNPDLRQTYQVNGNASFSRSNAAEGRMVMLMATATVVDDYIANATYLSRRDSLLPGGVVLPAGGQLTRPINLGRQVNARSFANYAMPIKGLKTNLNLTGSYGFTRTPGQVNGAVNQSDNHAFGGGVTFSSNISENVDFNIGTNPSYNLVRNTLQSSGNYNYYSQSSRLRLNVLLWKSISFTSNVTHTYYSGLSAGYNQNILLWNATLGKKLGKNKEWEVQLQAYDILKQNNSVSRTVSDVYIQDTRTTVLQRYFMLGVTYTLRKFQSSNPADDPEMRMRRRMMENMNPNGGPPPGPPPGMGGPPPGGGF